MWFRIKVIDRIKGARNYHRISCKFGNRFALCYCVGPAVVNGMFIWFLGFVCGRGVQWLLIVYYCVLGYVMLIGGEAAASFSPLRVSLFLGLFDKGWLVFFGFILGVSRAVAGEGRRRLVSCIQNRELGALGLPSEVYPAGNLQWHFTCSFDFRHSLRLPFVADFAVLKGLIICV